MVDFDIGADDFLEFRDGDSLYSEVLMRLEMEDTAYPVMSTGYTISVYLHTTSPRYKRGIQFTYIQSEFIGRTFSFALTQQTRNVDFFSWECRY